MIVLDTNVVSEPLRATPDPRVIAWLDAQAVETLYLTTILLAEIRFGIGALPEGKRRETLHERFEDEVVPLFARRILSFDDRASASYAGMRANARRRGETLPEMDAMVAAIARSNDLTVATRDTAHFIAAGVPVLDPFAG
ncbi:type II toxin-antitoxin system VapC family toxin [Pseudactinotalea terrae]|uniref:type II toxin-antitoxin system VapC family toxin n=1 Tax=Pseudactinotalea terrae TaxID=1743262 RepID=UPI0012E114BD|nr:type II toxin-antitoxin system VapC family toxin [Pseudactinotalea terrae]